ncbi:MAG: DUF6178 family protein [Desulfobacula sp.]|jgi:hypothetical protein
MDPNTDYQLSNIQKRELKLRTQRHDILTSDPEKALDMILEASSPATLIQSFPDQDLYYLMHKIGPYDFIPVLSMARSDQWEYILDMEVWDNDRLDTRIMTKTFDVLFQADPERLLRWVIKEKPDFFEFYLFKNMSIFIREHDEFPPDDFEDYITVDDKFYFRFPDKPEPMDETEDFLPENSEEASELIEKMLKKLAEMDLSVFHGLLLETSAVMTSETEEEQYRLKNLRLAEKGFLPPHEAIGIYQPTKLSALRKRPEMPSFKNHPFDPELPFPPQYFSAFIEGDDLFIAAMKLMENEFSLQLESELAALINKIISADRIRLRDKEDLEKAVLKARDYINLGLEIILKGRLIPELAGDTIQEYFLEDIFRTGSRAGIILKTKAVNWFKQSFMKEKKLPLSFLGETYLGVVGGLFLDRPLYHDNYASGLLYRNFKTIPDITRTGRLLDQVIALDTVLAKLIVDVSSFEEGLLTYKTLILTLWAKSRLKLPPDLRPIDTRSFKKFFVALFSTPDSEKPGQIQLNDFLIWLTEATGMSEADMGKEFQGILGDLIKELETEYSHVDPNKIDPRFIPHFLLKKKKG